MDSIITFPAAINANFNSNRRCYKYRLIVYNAKFSKSLFNKKERAKLTQKDGKFYLTKDFYGNLLNPQPEHQTTFMSVSKIFSKDQNYSDLRKDKKSNTLKIKINLNPYEWNLNKLDIFLESKEERDLAEKLIELGYVVQPVTFNDKDKFIHACADLILYDKTNKIPIEITTTAPSKTEALSGANSPHGHQWNKVSGRITPLVVYSLKNNLKSFMIANKKWEKYPHVKYLINDLINMNCHVLLSDFADNWSNEIAGKMNQLLINEK